MALFKSTKLLEALSTAIDCDRVVNRLTMRFNARNRSGSVIIPEIMNLRLPLRQSNILAGYDEETIKKCVHKMITKHLPNDPLNPDQLTVCYQHSNTYNFFGRPEIRLIYRRQCF